MNAKNKWPTLKEQLISSKVREGSALEKLIMDNQDFSLLEPEEADDGVALPLWLRVYWRKNHPDTQHPKVNPGEGYPDALYEIYYRMLTHQDRPLGVQGDERTNSRGNEHRDKK